MAEEKKQLQNQEEDDIILDYMPDVATGKMSREEFTKRLDAIYEKHKETLQAYEQARKIKKQEP